MANLYGKSITKAELLERVGDVSQIAGVKLVELADGREKGVAAAEVKTGSGLCFTVLLDRGMDISSASHNGRALAWRSATGDVSPAFYNAIGLEWLRGFFGGLVCTCGLTYLGAPCTDGDEELGVHGRVSNTPAQNVCVNGEWQGDDYVMSIKGEVREGGVFRDSLVLTRTITTQLGSNTIAIHDVVANRSFAPAPHMMLYHINLGFPVVDAGSRLVSPSLTVIPRDDAAADGKQSYAKFHAPTPDYQEKVYYHDVAAARSGETCAGIVSRRVPGGFGVCVKYSKKELPFLAEWKQMGQGTYVVGVEPANCHVEGRDKERIRGTLRTLAPGEKQEYHVEISVLDGRKAVQEFEQRVRQLMGRRKATFGVNEYGQSEGAAIE